MEVQNLSGDCLFSPTLIGLTGGKLDFGSIGQGAPYFDPRPFTFTNFRDEIINQYNTAFTPSFKQYINYEISAITQCVSAYTSGSTGIVNYWSADTVALPADYIRVSGNTTSAKVGGNLEVTGATIINNTLSAYSETLKDSLGVSGTTFLGSTLGVSGETFLGTVPTNTDDNPRVLIWDGNLKVTEQTLSTLTAKTSDLFWSADTTSLPSTYIRTSGNTTGVKIGGNLDVSGNTVVDGIITASGTSASPESKIQLVADTGEQLVGLERVGPGEPKKGQVKIRDNNAVDVYFTAEDNVAAYINNAGAALSIGATTISEANTNLYVTGGGIITGGLGVSGDTEVTGTLSADTMSGRTLTLKENLGVSGHTFLGSTLGVSGNTFLGTTPVDSTHNAKVLTIDTDTKVRYLSLATLTARTQDLFWSADTVSQPADYIRVSGNSTNVMVGGNLEVSGIVRTNIISNGNYESPITIMPDDSIKSIRFGYSTQQGAGSSYSFLNLDLGSPTATDTLFQLVQGGDLVFKGNTANAHELFRLDQTLNQASAYTMTVANGLGVSGDTEVAGTLSGRTISGRTLTLKENLGVSGRTFLGTLDAAGAGYSNDKILVAQSTGEVEYLTAAQVGGGGGFWSADTVAQPADYIRVSGNTTSAIVGGKLEVTGDTKIAGNFNVEKLFHNYTGDTNPSLFIGMLAGEEYSEGGFGANIALGYKAMQAEDSQSIRNVAIGAHALLSLEDGDYNTAIGAEALQFSTGGTNNVAIGWRAQAATTTLTHNTSVGVDTMYDSGVNNSIGGTNRRDNTVMGYASGYNMRWGNTNAAFGSESLAGDPFGTGNTGPTGCTATGYRALYGNCQGSFNTGLGYRAGDNITTGDYNISIGPDADPPSATGDYQMNIGGIIFGNDEYTDSAISQIGIGYNDPKVKLDVHHDPTDLADDTGGGEVIYFGADHGSETCSAGKLMYMNSSGVWRYADADNTGKGADDLLGLCIADSISQGMLIRGFFDLATELADTFVKGRACYVGTPNTGQVQFAQPSGSGDFVRVVGYGTSTANVIYFNPDGTYITVA